MENIQKEGCCASHKKAIHFLAPLVGLLLIALIVFLAVSSYNSFNKKGDVNQTMTFSESADIYAKPDLAVIDFSVISEASTVEKAMNDNTLKMDSVIKAIKAEGIEDKDIKTTNYYISPRYEYYDSSSIVKPMIYSSEGQRVLAGYGISQTVNVKIRDFSKIGGIIAKATSNGANQVGNLSLDIEKRDELEKQARDVAINKAKAKAKNLEKQLGIKLGRISGFSESGSNPIYYDSMNLKGMGVGGGEASVPAPQIEAGQNKITASVSITYEIK